MNATTPFTATNTKILPPRQFFIRLLPWLISVILVVLFTLAMLLLQVAGEKPADQVTVRKIDVALPPPPPPPPPLELQKPQSNTPAPTMDFIGMGDGPAMNYSVKPELGMENLEKIKPPKFDPESLDIQKTLSFSFPLIEVEKLDNIPRAVSSNSAKFPSSLINKGIKNVDTKVELIIDQKGKAYIKRIVDSVYPEMVEPIRHWVKGVRFTIPTKNGKPVQAVYPYTLRFVYRAE